MRAIWLIFGCVVLTPLVCSAQAGNPPESINLRQTVTVQVVQQTQGAVVNISATKTVAKRMSPFGDDPFFRGLGIGDIVQVPASSLGSGFIVHPDGYVVTNHHVIDRARSVSVELADGRKLPAELISSDPDADLAILKIPSDQPLPTIRLGDSSDLMIGEPVIAVGNPLGYSHSVSTGIISAIHRDLKDGSDRVILGDLVQTDAAINPGNSGGPLLNAYGQVIGINTAIRGDAQNIGFAIPVNNLRDLIPELMNPSQARRIELPIKLREKRTLAPPAKVDCQVCTADDDRPITAINGQKPRDLVDAYAMLLREKAGETLTIEREGAEPLAIPVTASPVPATVTAAREKLGLVLEPVTPMLAEKYALSVETGLFAKEVLRDSPAWNAGVKAGDILIQLGRYRVNTLDDLGTLLAQNAKVRVTVVRGDRIGTAVVELGK